MDQIIDVKIGLTHTPEEWFKARDGITNAVKGLAEQQAVMRKMGMAIDPGTVDFVNQLIMAIAALDYVARFASENCRFLLIGRKNGNQP